MFEFCEIERTFRDGSKYNQGWHLRVDSLEKLITWFDNRNDFLDIWTELKTNKRGHYNNHQAHLFEFLISNINKEKISISEFSKIHSSTVLNSKADSLNKHGAIFINSVGGWCLLGDGNIIERISAKDLIFPAHDLSEIKFEKFPNGTHYYASCNGQSIVISGIEKWDSLEEAKEATENYINNQKTKEEEFND